QPLERPRTREKQQIFVVLVFENHIDERADDAVDDFRVPAKWIGDGDVLRNRAAASARVAECALLLDRHLDGFKRGGLRHFTGSEARAAAAKTPDGALRGPVRPDKEIEERRTDEEISSGAIVAVDGDRGTGAKTRHDEEEIAETLEEAGESRKNLRLGGIP